MDKFMFTGNKLIDSGINYSFGEMSADFRYPYFVGEMNEIRSESEDGSEESTLIITGYCRGSGSLSVLSDYIKTIKEIFPAVYGCRGSTDHGSIAVFFDSAMYLPSVESDLKRVQITLKIKEWTEVY